MKRKLDIIFVVVIAAIILTINLKAANSKMTEEEEKTVPNEELLLSEEVSKEIIAETTAVQKEETTETIYEDIITKSTTEEVLTSEAASLNLANAAAGTIISISQLKNLNIQDFFYQQEISDALFQRIYRKSFKENCSTPRGELVYIRVLYYGFDEESHIGELISNKNIAQELIDIFAQLYAHKYQIGKMVLIDDYDADDERSMADNNTSCFNFRQVSGSASLSKHSMGYAIDINPLYNPYIRTVNGAVMYEPENGAEYAERTNDFPHKIDKNDLCYQLFNQYGYTWGGDWNSVKDYQHFEKVID